MPAFAADPTGTATLRVDPAAPVNFTWTLMAALATPKRTARIPVHSPRKNKATPAAVAGVAALAVNVPRLPRLSRGAWGGR